MPDDPDEDAELQLSDPTYWAAHPDALNEALSELTGVDTPGIARRRLHEADLRNLVRLPLDLASELLSRQQTTAVGTPDKRLTLTVEEAANLLGISRTLAYEAVRRGEIPHIKLGSRILIPKTQLDRLLAGDAPSADAAG